MPFTYQERYIRGFQLASCIVPKKGYLFKMSFVLGECYLPTRHLLWPIKRRPLGKMQFLHIMHGCDCSWILKCSYKSMKTAVHRVCKNNTPRDGHFDDEYWNDFRLITTISRYQFVNNHSLVYVGCTGYLTPTDLLNTVVHTGKAHRWVLVLTILPII